MASPMGEDAVQWPFVSNGIGSIIPRIEWTAPKITLAYATFGIVALFMSDLVLLYFLTDPVLGRIQALKGGVEVLLTAGLIYLLTKTSRGQVQVAKNEVQKQRDELRLLHRVFRHNLRNDLNLIAGYADELCDTSTSNPSGIAYDGIFSTVDKIEEYTEYVRKIRQVSGANESISIDLADSIPRVIGYHSSVTRDVVVSTDIPEDAVVRAHPKFMDAVEELITNAIQHNDAATPEIRIEVHPASGPARMTEIVVSDNGPGIPSHEREALDTDLDTQLFHSTGIGLWFVDWLVGHSDGYLVIDTTDDGGAAVSVYLPSGDEPADHRRVRPEEGHPPAAM